MISLRSPLTFPCTLSLQEVVDAGAIIVQHSVPVFPRDTEHTLAERVKTVEHTAYPAALDMVASGQVELDHSGSLVWNW